jgi:hypothetical protein
MRLALLVVAGSCSGAPPVAPAAANQTPDPGWSCGCVAGLCLWYTVGERNEP